MVEEFEWPIAERVAGRRSIEVLQGDPTIESRANERIVESSNESTRAPNGAMERFTEELAAINRTCCLWRESCVYRQAV